MRPDQAQKLYGTLFSAGRGFGELVSAKYKVGGAGAGVDVPGAFLDRPVSVSLGEAATTLDGQASYSCLRSQIPAGATGGDAGDTMIVRDVAYKVLSIEPDEAGKVVIVLGH